MAKDGQSDRDEKFEAEATKQAPPGRFVGPDTSVDQETFENTTRVRPSTEIAAILMPQAESAVTKVLPRMTPKALPAALAAVDDGDEFDTAVPTLVTPERESQAQRLGRYILMERLAVGNTTEVFRAVAFGVEQFQTAVAIKKLRADRQDDIQAVARFVREAKLSARLGHPNIVQVHDLGQQNGTYFIAMEYIDGLDLEAVFSRLAARKERMPTAIVAEIGRQVSLALGYAHAIRGPDGHALGVVHRNVLPGNIMLGRSGVIKLLDFGVANIFAGEPSRIDGRADIRCLGAVLYEGLIGQRVFDGGSPLETSNRIHNMTLLPPSGLNPDIPRRLDTIVMRALERQPERRYAGALELARELDNFLFEGGYARVDVPSFVTSLFQEPKAQPASAGRPASPAPASKPSVFKTSQPAAVMNAISSALADLEGQMSDPNAPGRRLSGEIPIEIPPTPSAALPRQRRNSVRMAAEDEAPPGPRQQVSWRLVAAVVVGALILGFLGAAALLRH